MSLLDRSYMKRLIDKYGDDYEAMFYDKKLNSNQLSLGQLQRKVRDYWRVMKKLEIQKDKKLQEDAALLE